MTFTDAPGRASATEEQLPVEPALTADELAAEAARLDERRNRLAIVRAELKDATDAYSEAISAANERYAATTKPLSEEEKQLIAAITRSEKAATELEARRQRVEDLRRQLQAAENELPTEAA
jgi:chromosome segregation ATPase